MNARVFLLILVTAAFMGVWNSDQQAMQAALARRQKAIETRLAQHEPALDVVLHNSPIRIAMAGDGLLNTSPLQNAPFIDNLLTATPLNITVSDITASDVFSRDAVEVVELNEIEVEELLPEPDVPETAPKLLPLVPIIMPLFESPEDLTLDLSSGNASPGITSPAPQTSTRGSAATLGTFANFVSHSVVALMLASVDNSWPGSRTSEAGSSSDCDESENDEAENDEPLQELTGSERDSANSNGDLRHSNRVDSEDGPTIPLPSNLANGTWQVVDSEGASFKITIERSAISIADFAASRRFEESFCIRSTAEGERWCFIRSYRSAAPAGRVATEFFSPLQEDPGRQ